MSFDKCLITCSIVAGLMIACVVRSLGTRLGTCARERALAGEKPRETCPT